MTDNPLDKIAALGRLLQERAAAIGLELQAFMPMPDLSGGGAHMIQGIFLVDASAVEAAEETDEDADELAGILEATAHMERERVRQAKADAARERAIAMQEKLDRGEGLLD